MNLVLVRIQLQIRTSQPASMNMTIEKQLAAYSTTSTWLFSDRKEPSDNSNKGL